MAVNQQTPSGFYPMATPPKGDIVTGIKTQHARLGRTGTVPIVEVGYG